MKHSWNVYVLQEKKMGSMVEACAYADGEVSGLQKGGYCVKKSADEDPISFTECISSQLAAGYNVACAHVNLSNISGDEITVSVECGDGRQANLNAECSEEKVYVLKGRHYVQVEIELDFVTHIFLVPKEEEDRYFGYLTESLMHCHYTISEVLEEAAGNGYTLHYMCTLDDEDTVSNFLLIDKGIDCNQSVFLPEDE